MAKFNLVIDGLALIELPLLDHLYTWSNKRAMPTLARLDRTFINGGFAQLFPSFNLNSHLGSTSDHIPLILTAPTSNQKSFRFRFENAWLKHPTFLPSILPVLSRAFVPSNVTSGLVGRIKALHHGAKAWSKKHRDWPND